MPTQLENLNRFNSPKIPTGQELRSTANISNRPVIKQQIPQTPNSLPKLGVMKESNSTPKTETSLPQQITKTNEFRVDLALKLPLAGIEAELNFARKNKEYK